VDRRAFFAAKSPDLLPALVGVRVLSVPQGIVLPAFEPRLAEIVRLSVDELRQVLAGERALLGGQLFEPGGLPADEFDRHTRVAAIRAAGVTTNWVRDALPIVDDADAEYDLVQSWLVLSQRRRDRLVELGGRPSLIAWEDASIRAALETLAALSLGKPMRWRSYARCDDPPLTCSLPPKPGAFWRYVESVPGPDVPLQLAVPTDDEVAVVFPHVALVLAMASDQAVVRDAFATRGAQVEWTRDGVLGFGTMLRRDGRWLEGPLPACCPDVLLRSVEDFDDQVLAVRTNERSPIALWSPAAELRRCTPDGLFGVLVRYRDERRRKLTHANLVQLQSGEPIPTRYDGLLNRAVAVAYHAGELTIAVNGAVLCSGRSLARYRKLAHGPASFRAPAPLAAFDPRGHRFAWCVDRMLHSVDLESGSTRRYDLAPLRSALAPLNDLELAPPVRTALLEIVGAAPLAPRTSAALEIVLHEDEHRDELRQHRDELVSAFSAHPSWPQLPVVR
jgi:hypothetical protein